MNRIEIFQGDIIKAKVDIIVNAANPKMLGGGGVDGAIHQAAGPKLLEACRRVKATNGIRCPFGEARITDAGSLSAKYIIHAVGPRYRHEKQPEKLLTSVYQQSMDLALEHECSSIAFPALSCGAYGYPAKEASEIALKVCANSKYNNVNIEFYLFTKDLYEIWIKTLKNLRNK